MTSAPAPATLPAEDPVIATGTALGPELMAGVSPDVSFAVWQVLRSLRLWTAQPESLREGMFSAEYMEAWERALLTGSLEPDVRFPLAVIVGELAAPAADTPRLSWACVCAADWALGRGAVRAGLAFAEAAALASPGQARYAWLAGRLMRTHGEGRAGERWLRRAYRVAVAQRDVETQARALTALGNLALQRGNYPAARTFHLRSLRIARRWKLREQEGMANHDLFAIAIRDNNRSEAERFARGALEAYRAVPARLPRLAHDVAYWWMEHGYYRRALRTFEAVQTHMGSEDRFRVLANIAHSHAGLGNREQFLVSVEVARGFLGLPERCEVPATALLEFAYGAISLDEWEIAAEFSCLVLEVARARGEADALLAADALIGVVRRREGASIPLVFAESRVGTGEQLADDFVELLTKEGVPVA